MVRLVSQLSILFVFPALALAQPAAAPTPPPDVPALVAKAEPAIACILVSRSPLYRKFGLVTGLEKPGVLGDVPGERLSRLAGFDKELILQLKLDDPLHVPEAFGTGLIIDPKGLVLTNYHVVREAVKVFVRWPNGHGSYADIHAADPRSDLAVLRLLTPPDLPLTAIRFGNADDIRRGETVIALSNPYVAGFLDGHPSVSVGVVSNLRRRIPGRQPIAESSAANPLYQFGLLMQTDAKLALGSSGGALLNTKGECIGITTALAALAGSDVPGGFAVPVTTRMRKIIDTLGRGEEVDYGFLGVSLETDATDGKVHVKSVQANSPAQRASIAKFDIIVDVDGVPVRDNQDLFLALSTCQAGDRTTITLEHEFVKKRVQATLVKAGKSSLVPIATSLGKRPYVGGMRVDYTSIVSNGPAERMKEGVLVVDIQKDSQASKLKLFVDDIITQVNDRKVNTPEAFYAALSRARAPIMLTVRRDEQIFRKRWE